jgi:hypothetical protein
MATRALAVSANATSTISTVTAVGNMAAWSHPRGLGFIIVWAACSTSAIPEEYRGVLELLGIGSIRAVGESVACVAL